MKTIIVGLVAVFVFCMLAVGAKELQVGPLKTERRSVSQRKAKSVRATFKMGNGQIVLGNGSNELMDAEFKYNVAEWKPKVMYSVKGSEGRLTVQQPEVDGSAKENAIYRWDVRLGHGVPISLDIEQGNGKTELDLKGLTVTNADVTTGNGRVTMNLGGTHTSLNTTSIKMGNGVIDAWFTGTYPALRKVNISKGNGSVKLDLTGDWRRDADISVNTGNGDMALTVPRDIGVSVRISSGLSRVHTTGLTKQGENYINEAFRNSNVTLTLHVTAGAGDVTIKAE